MKVNEYGYRGRQRTGHTYAPRGKRVLVSRYDGSQFVAKFKTKEGRFHHFLDHAPIKSSTIKQLSILTTDFDADGLDAEVEEGVDAA